MTLDPITGDRTKIVIDCRLRPRRTGRLRRDHARQFRGREGAAARSSGGGSSRRTTSWWPTAPARRTVDRVIEAAAPHAALARPTAQVIAVARLAKSLEKQHGLPAGRRMGDRSRSARGENLVALQSRPETVWSRKKAAARKTYAMGIEGVLGSAALAAPGQAMTLNNGTSGGEPMTTPCEISEPLRSEGAARRGGLGAPLSLLSGVPGQSAAARKRPSSGSATASTGRARSSRSTR